MNGPFTYFLTPLLPGRFTCKFHISHHFATR